MLLTLRTALTRVALPIILLTLAIIQFRQGGDSLSAWLANAAVKTGIGPVNMVRLLIGLELAGAALSVLYRRLAAPLAWTTFAGMAFSSLAEFSTLFNAPGNGALPASAWSWPVTLLVVGGGGLLLLNLTSEAAKAAAKEGAATPGRITPWRVLLAIFIVMIAGGIATRVVVADRTIRSAGGVPSIALNTDDWVGHRVPETGLSKYLPSVTPITLEGTKWIVFYQPTCSRCHEIFRTYFPGNNAFDVIAIEVPHAPDETVLPGDQLGDVECQDCTRFKLPGNTRWIVTTPTIVKVENGVITCVEAVNYDRCRQPPPPQP